jgi:hypothetical protein
MKKEVRQVDAGLMMACGCHWERTECSGQPGMLMCRHSTQRAGLTLLLYAAAERVAGERDVWQVLSVRREPPVRTGNVCLVHRTLAVRCCCTESVTQYTYLERPIYIQQGHRVFGMYQCSAPTFCLAHMFPCFGAGRQPSGIINDSSLPLLLYVIRRRMSNVLTVVKN